MTRLDTAIQNLKARLRAWWTCVNPIDKALDILIGVSCTFILVLTVILIVRHYF